MTDRSTGTADAGRLLDPSLYAGGDPFALYAELRRTAPVCWVDHEGGGFWAVTTHPEVSHIGADPGAFCSSRGILDRRDRHDLRDAADHDAHRPAAAHPLPPTGAARLQAVDGATDGGRGDGEGDARSWIRSRAAWRSTSCSTSPSVPAPGDLRAAGRGRVAVAPLLRLVRGRHPRRGGADRGAAAAHQIEMWEYLVGVAEERRQGAGGRPRVGAGDRRIRSRE